MNDPHVSVLIYQVRRDETVTYHKASLLEYETTSFKISVKSCEARFEMKEHFPTAEKARELVEPFIRQWEFAKALDRDAGEFELVFLGAVVEDGQPFDQPFGDALAAPIFAWTRRRLDFDRKPIAPGHIDARRPSWLAVGVSEEE